MPPLVGGNTFTGDTALGEALGREGGAWGEPRLTRFGALMATEEVVALGFQANEHPPILHTHDRFGERRDEVEYHSAWHELLRIALEHGLHSSPWADPQPGAHVVRAALLMQAVQVEAGQSCPITMTYGSVPTLRIQPDVGATWEQKAHSTEYDPRFLAVGDKSSALLGMAMTERQGGSDVRANTTRAEPMGQGGAGAEYLITGHKWFCSAPMCDAFLVLAYSPGGLSCFLLPRWTPDGEKNGFFIERLKDKLGNRSNASCEVAFEGAWARMIGDEGRGVPTIIEMANHTRLDCIIGSSAMMRQGVAQAVHHARHRMAFGRLLAEQPLMRNVLADLCIESEAATVLMMRLARSYDHQDDRDLEGPFRRIATAVGKYFVTKRAVWHVFEALECLGGNGYVESSIMPRMFRECPLNSIWEGSGNIMCLDLLRASTRQPRSIEVMLEEIKLGQGADRRLDGFISNLESEITDGGASELNARRFAEQLALALQASLLVRFSTPAVADAFCVSRLAGEWGSCYGTLPDGVDLNAIIDRAS